MIETLLNDVTMDGMRRVKLVSDVEIDLAAISRPMLFPPAGETVRQWKDDALGLYYLEATWPCREVVKLQLEGQPCARPVALWKLQPGERVSLAFRDACAAYAEHSKIFPDFAFMRRLPKEIENGFELNDVTFFQSDWVPTGCIAVFVGG